jgi:hypothetical protein
MLQVIVEGMLYEVPRVVGWAVLKLITLGRYRGSGPEDILVEGGIGLAAILGVSLAAYRWWPL